jgi:hypothetical protein
VLSFKLGGSAAIAAQIKQRTDALLKKLGNVAVSSKPIVMKAEFAYCPNLTIIGETQAPGLPPVRLRDITRLIDRVSLCPSRCRRR